MTVTALLVFGSVLGLIFLGVPVAFAIITAGIFIFTVSGTEPLILFASRLTTGMDSFPLLAVPLFILAGNIMDKGGISKRLIQWAESIVGFLPGSMGMVAILSCTFFAALTGSGPATVAAIGFIVIPPMMNRAIPTEWPQACLLGRCAGTDYTSQHTHDHLRLHDEPFHTRHVYRRYHTWPYHCRFADACQFYHLAEDSFGKKRSKDIIFF
jgi:hypothetical protein